MFTFLAPFALAASAALAVPVVIHLLKPKRVRTMPFSSLRWLRSSKHRLSRRIQWHQLLLFLLRAVFLSALVLALAKPVFSRSGGQGLRERFVIVDVSRSMGYAAPGMDTPLERAKKGALALLAQGLPGDRTTVVLAGNRATALGPLSADPGVYAARVKSALSTAGDTDLCSALALIRPQLETPRPDTRVELFFLTDNHQGAWSQQALLEFTADLKLPLSVHVVDVGPLAPGNAWIADVRTVEVGGRPFLRARLGASGAEPLERTLLLKKPNAQGESSRAVTLPPGALTEVDLPLPSVSDSTFPLAELALEPRDALPEDDLFWLPLGATGPRVLMLEPLTTQIESLQPGFHVRAALEALRRGASGGLQIVRRTPESVVASDFAEADLVVLANVPELSDDRLLALEARVREGAGLLLFLGPSVRSSFYNTRMHRTSQPELSLLPAPLGEVATGGLAGLTGIEWAHPLLAPLSDPVFSDLTRVRAHAHYHMEMPPGRETPQILCRFEGGAPALLEHLVGAGRVLVLNTTANDEWSDLPRRASFVPLLDRMLERYAFSKQGRSFQAGEPVAVPVPIGGKNVRISVNGPDGRSVPFTSQGEGARALARLENPSETGVYILRAEGEAGSAQTSFVVHAGLGDAQVQKMDPETLRLWWRGAPVEITHPDAKSDAPEVPPGDRVLLWPYLLACAALLLLAETYLVHRLTPALNPAVASSSVAQHGILAPASRKEVRP